MVKKIEFEPIENNDIRFVWALDLIVNESSEAFICDETILFKIENGKCYAVNLRDILAKLSK